MLGDRVKSLKAGITKFKPIRFDLQLRDIACAAKHMAARAATPEATDSAQNAAGKRIKSGIFDVRDGGNWSDDHRQIMVLIKQAMRALRMSKIESKKRIDGEMDRTIRYTLAAAQGAMNLGKFSDASTHFGVICNHFV